MAGKITAEDLLDLLSKANTRNQFANPYQNQGLSSNVFSTSDISSLAKQPSSFFGPLGMLGLQAIDRLGGGLGLIREGYGGAPTPVFNTAVNFRDTGMSAFQQQMADINGNTFAAAFGATNKARQRDVAGLFGDKSLFGAIRRDATGDMADILDFMKSQGSSAQGSQVIQQIVNGITGYDEGMGATVAANRSIDVTGGMLARGGIAGMKPGSVMDPTSEAFQRARGTIAGMIEMGSHDLTFKALGQKNANIHGASNELVAQIMSDAMQSGNIDEGLMRKSLAGAKGMDKLGLNGDFTMSDVITASGTVADQMSALQKEQNAAVERRAGLKDKTGSEAKKLDDEIKARERELSELADTSRRLAKSIADGAAPLEEAVTNVVDTLKTFYGDETEAKKALDRLTGGQGSKNKKIADQVNRQMEDIRDSAILAGMSPAQAAQHVENLQSQLMMHGGSGIGAGNAFSGAMAMQLGGMSFNIMRQFNGDQRRQQHIANAFNEFAGSFDESEARNFSILLENARMEGTIDEEEYNRLREKGQNGDYDDFTTAFNQLKTRVTGSVTAGNRLVRNRQAMAELSNRVSEDPEALARAQEFAGNVISAEMGKINVRAGRRSRQIQQENQLIQQGFTSNEIVEQENAAKGNAIEETLRGMGKEAAGVLDAYNAKKRSLMDKGMSEADATRAANTWFDTTFGDKSKGGPLSQEQKDKIEAAIATGTENALSGMGGFEKGDKKNFIKSRGLSRNAASVLTTAGIIDENGDLSGEAATQGANDLLNNMISNAEMLGMDQGKLADQKKQIMSLLKSGKQADQDKGLQQFLELLDQAGSTDAGKAVLTAGLDKGNYRTAAAKRREAETADKRKVFDNIMQQTESAKFLQGFETEDARFTMAGILNDIGKDNYGKLKVLEGDDLDKGRERLKALEKKGGKRTKEEEEEYKLLKANVEYTDLQKKRKDDKDKAEKDREGASAALMKGLTENDWTDFAAKFKAAGVSMEDFEKTIQNLIKFIAKDVLGEAVGEGKKEGEGKEGEGAKADSGKGGGSDKGKAGGKKPYAKPEEPDAALDKDASDVLKDMSEDDRFKYYQEHENALSDDEKREYDEIKKKRSGKYDPKADKSFTEEEGVKLDENTEAVVTGVSVEPTFEDDLANLKEGLANHDITWDDVPTFDEVVHEGGPDVAGGSLDDLKQATDDFGGSETSPEARQDDQADSGNGGGADKISRIISMGEQLLASMTTLTGEVKQLVSQQNSTVAIRNKTESVS